MLVVRLILIFIIFLFSINIALAGDISQFVFTTNPQTIKPNEVSEKITVQSQEADGNSAKIIQTACLEFKTTSNAGEFSSSNTNWSSVGILTMSKGTANRSFYYKDSDIGNYAITINIALRPEEEKRSCASWPVEEWDIKWSLMQNIIISEPVSKLEPESETETQQQTTTVVDSQSDSVAKQEQAAVIENSDPVAQPQPQVESVVEPDKKPAKNTQTEIQKTEPEPKPTTVVDSGTKVKENPASGGDVGNLVSDSQVANVITATKSDSWSLKKWLAIILGIGIIASVGFFFIRRQSSV